ncbi:MAG: hypothetical protein HY815_28480 [Candidatus Riflebacteria bacterium]|nr:hypothetical protein [Candidatus Riflebacteria bacterium]
MRKNVWLSGFVALVCLACVAGPGWAQAEAGSPASTDQARVRAEYHRAMAALIEAESAQKPDNATIERLKGQVQALENQLPEKQNLAGGQGAGSTSARCGAAGCGQGRAGSSCGAGRGCGAGYRGRRGAGGGQGFGQGRRARAGAGRGGACFVDANQNGVCDKKE